MKASYDEAYRRYSEAFTHTDEEKVNGNPVFVTYKPEAVCNHRELDRIFASCTTWQKVFAAMRACVGTAGPAKSRN